jgi:hypothetical protein
MINDYEIFIPITSLFFLTGCLPDTSDSFNSVILVSSEKEKAYINTLNWSVTGDKQLTIITADKNLLRHRDDTKDAISGLDPFIYSFKNDSLNLYFDRDIKYTPKVKFNTITVSSFKLNSNEYYTLYHEALNGNGYFTVPPRP